MSDAVSALAGARFEGYVTVEDAGPVGMVTIRGDLGAPGLAAAVSGATGLALPAPRAVVSAGEARLAWMSPDELLLFCPHGEAPARAAALAAALADQHALVAEVSDARALLRLTGAPGLLREVLAKLTPADLRPAAFGPGTLRRSRLGQVAAAFHMAEAGRVEVVVFRSVARYAFDLLANAAKPGGEVGLFA